MEGTATPVKTGFLGRVTAWLMRSEPIEAEEPSSEFPAPRTELQVRTAVRYTVTVRNKITSFDDAVAAANGIKRGEQQILNLVECEASLRAKIVYFMQGVGYAHEGTWEEIAQYVYLICPANAKVDSATPTPAASAAKN
ncbi:MAG: cell division protein SepF [Fimbriimonas sp.]